MNKNIHFSEGNIKSKNTDDIIFLTWSLPSKITCPYATELCKKKCFAKKNEAFSGVRDSRQRNLDETKKATFVDDVINYLEYQLQRKKMQNKKVFVRIHTSGDFYNVDYLKKWIKIAQHFKENESILFQCYTKSMPILLEWLWDDNGVWCDDEPIEDTLWAIKDTNINFVWSIWHDTPKEYTNWAEVLELQTFTALPKDEIEEAVLNGSFLCMGDCGNCKECYTGKSKSIVIPYH
jgi:hypothetical protein